MKLFDIVIRCKDCGNENIKILYENDRAYYRCDKCGEEERI